MILEDILAWPRSEKKFWRMKLFPGHEKVRDLHCQSGKFRRNKRKVMEKPGNFIIFPKKLLGFWKFYFS